MSEMNLEKLRKEISAGVSLIDFYATWCGPCKMVAPIVDEIGKEFPDVKILKVNVDEETEIAANYGVQVIPTFVVVKDGEILDHLSGLVNKTTIVNALIKALAK